MGTVVAVVAAVVLVAAYVTWTAGRLDRLHARVEAAWAVLDAQLVRRAAAAAEVADAAGGAHGSDGLAGLPVGLPADLRAAAAAARSAGTTEREAAENDLSRELAKLGAVVPAQPAGAPAVARSLSELAGSATRVVIARRFYNDAVRDTRALRNRRVVRWLRLAGHAGRPAYFEIDDTPMRPGG